VFLLAGDLCLRVVNAGLQFLQLFVDECLAFLLLRIKPLGLCRMS